MAEFEPELNLDIDVLGYKGKNRRHSANGPAEDLAGFVNRIVRDSVVANKVGKERDRAIDLASRNSSKLPSEIEQLARKDFLRAVDNSLKNMQSIVDAEFADGDSDRSVDDLFIEKRRYLRALALAVKRTIVFALDRDAVDAKGDAVGTSSNDVIVAMLSRTPYSQFADDAGFINTVKSVASGVRRAADCVDAHYFPCLSLFQAVMDDFKSGKRPKEDAEHFIREMLMSIYLFVVYGHDGKDRWSADIRHVVSDANVRDLTNALLRADNSTVIFNIFLPGNTTQGLKAISVKYSNNQDSGVSISLELRGDFEPDLRARFDRLHDEPAQFYKRPLPEKKIVSADTPAS
ncbi:MAG: hypothetical protein UT33_C0007G0082 [Candidatus Peregrinibacteria bacterium GW2011_GWC2_39_14]|nr:MAG: hypothetical protein US92_C0002G0083 [Candidatus Peregrinibacteria bacterium GW2011_GWA2_38_36]KKR06894.1 MAG: hypothetical protein UT33_C0007G0082 [Candidatus Peregrinibacteria bacterium GW2011_GWC2_39_14]